MREEDARAIAGKVLARATAEHVTVRVEAEDYALTRFANNAITQNVARSNRTIRVDAAFGLQKGSAEVNAADDDSLAAVVERAEAIARLAPPDPEYMPPPAPPVPPAGFPPVEGFVERTAAATPEERAALAREAVVAAEGAGMTVAGIVSTAANARAIANNRGLFAYHRNTEAAFSATPERGGASGWVRRTHPDLGALGVAEAVGVAIEKAASAADPISWPPGRYTVILEPAAVTGLLGPMTWGGMSARETFEGRTFLAGKLGQRLVAERVHLASDPFHPLLFGQPWFADGLPARKVVWIEQGKFVNLFYDRFTAGKHGVAPTPFPGQLVLDCGGSGTVADLIAETEKGILVTHFWYIRFVDPMRMLLTGMTRDGLFAIEDGKVTRGLRNFRWNMSSVDMLANIRGATTPIAASDVESDPMLVPALKVADWDFTSETSF